MTTKNSLEFLEDAIAIKRKGKKELLSFEEYLEEVIKEPEKNLRNIFQLFHDMVKSYVGEGVDEYPDDPESIGFVKYDCLKLFVEGADNPFFADRLFANRFVRRVEGLRQGFQQNKIYIYDGPSGCGKSTFLNNILRAFEDYTNAREGQAFEIIWEIDESIFLTGDNQNCKFSVPCPSHDYPILLVPKYYRNCFLQKLLPEEIKPRVFGNKEYEWIFRGEICTICKSIFWALFEKLGSLDKVLRMVKIRTCKFDRRVGDGISVFNPGDKPIWGAPDGKPVGGYFTNKQIQERLDRIFGINTVKYAYSQLAKTNNGIYVLMDVKSHNRDRLLELHNVISEGVHKVSDIEEQINSLFLALMNPEDKKVIEEEKMESFEGRIQYNKIPFVLEPAVELCIYRTIFGESIEKHFLPRVLENFTKVVIASRMKTECVPLKEWIPDIKKYQKYCDENGILLRMELYSGIIPEWLSEEDKKKFTAPVRRAIISGGENEGDHGFSGRESIGLFTEFFSRYGIRINLIGMTNVIDFFKHKIEKESRDKNIPKNFLASLLDSYDYTVLSEVKEALYFYNKEQIQKDILNYLSAINYDPGVKIKCEHTGGQELEVTLDFLKLVASRITGREMNDSDALKFAQDTQKKYITVITKERAKAVDTELYKELFTAYVKNLKEKVLQPFLGNENFREAIKSFGTENFHTFDTRLKEHISYMIENLVGKFGYTEEGAKEICLYVLDKNLVQKFS